MGIADRKILGGPLTPIYVAGGEELEITSSEDWRSSIQTDGTLNDSDKTFVVPADQEWQILNVWVALATSVDVGDRQIAVQLQDAAGIAAGEVRAGAVQATTITRYYNFSPPCADLFGFRDTDFLMTPLPFWVLPPTTILRVYDNAAIAAGADDMIVRVMVALRTV